MMRKYKHFTLEDRMIIERMRNSGESLETIAKALKKSQSSISRELNSRSNDGIYDAHYANEHYKSLALSSGCKPKLEQNRELLDFVRRSILEDKLSPKQIVDKIKEGKTSFSPTAVRSYNTIYSAIDKGLIPNVSRKTLQKNHITTMFSEGNIIIPKWIREDLLLEAGDQFDVEIGDKKQIIITKITYRIRPILPQEREQAISLIWDTFLKFEAPDYSEQGVDTFHDFIFNENIFGNIEFFGAFEDNDLRGVIASRDERKHICCFFVPAAYQRQGIGRQLWEYLKDTSKASTITVNSSPFAVPVYHKLGFVGTNTEQLTDGIRYTPMQFTRK